VVLEIGPMPLCTVLLKADAILQRQLRVNVTRASGSQ
jgi:hypothetical protein